MSVDLRNSSSESDAAQQVAEFVAGKLNSKDWIVGRGWNQVLWPEKKFPTKASFDKRNQSKPNLGKRATQIFN